MEDAGELWASWYCIELPPPSDFDAVPKVKPLEVLKPSPWAKMSQAAVFLFTSFFYLPLWAYPQKKALVIAYYVFWLGENVALSSVIVWVTTNERYLEQPPDSTNEIIPILGLVLILLLLPSAVVARVCLGKMLKPPEEIQMEHIIISPK